MKRNIANYIMKHKHLQTHSVLILIHESSMLSMVWNIWIRLNSLHVVLDTTVYGDKSQQCDNVCFRSLQAFIFFLRQTDHHGFKALNWLHIMFEECPLGLKQYVESTWESRDALDTGSLSEPRGQKNVEDFPPLSSPCISYTNQHVNLLMNWNELLFHLL